MRIPLLDGHADTERREVVRNGAPDRLTARTSSPTLRAGVLGNAGIVLDRPRSRPLDVAEAVIAKAAPLADDPVSLARVEVLWAAGALPARRRRGAACTETCSSRADCSEAFWSCCDVYNGGSACIPDDWVERNPEATCD